MAKFYYQMPVDSQTGRRLSRFWHACMKCEKEADNYAKKMGGQYYYSDPRYFAGGVRYISFVGNKPQDPKMWREVGTVRADGTFDDASKEGYHGAMFAGDVVYFEPNVTQRLEWKEVPSEDFCPTDTFDTFFSKEKPVERKDEKGNPHYYVQCMRFIYDEPEGRSGSAYPAPRTASRLVRRAIKAEVKRKRLPVMRTEVLLSLLGAEWLKTETKAGTPVKTPDTTPTFFAYEDHYYVGCDYECKSEDLREISAQTHKTYMDLFEIASRRKAD